MLQQNDSWLVFCVSMSFHNYLQLLYDFYGVIAVLRMSINRNNQPGIQQIVFHRTLYSTFHLLILIFSISLYQSVSTFFCINITSYPHVIF